MSTRPRQAMGDIIVKGEAYQRFLRTPAAQEALASLPDAEREAFAGAIEALEERYEDAVDAVTRLDDHVTRLEMDLEQCPPLQAALAQYIEAIGARRSEGSIPH